MIWIALLLGVVLGVAFDRTLDWFLLDPTEYRKRLEQENAALRLHVATLQQQLEVFSELDAAARLAREREAEASGDEHDGTE